MAVKSWKDIREKKFSVEELGAIDQEVEAELLEMDLRTLREARGSRKESSRPKSTSLSRSSPRWSDAKTTASRRCAGTSRRWALPGKKCGSYVQKSLWSDV